MSEVLIRSAVETSLRVTAVAALVALVLVAVRVRSSSVRHTAWVAVLLAMVLMPVLPHFVPAVSVAVPAPAARPVNALTELVTSFDWSPMTSDPVASAKPGEIGTVSATASPEMPANARVMPGRRSLWPAVVAGIYALGLFLLASRLFIGWRRARRLVENRVRESIPLLIDPKRALSKGNRLPESIFESALVVTPLTVGVLAPRIILPLSWRAWPEQKLQAVLEHERAHIARRDPLIAFVAAVNRCVFWFHPLAWWLERKLATTAEHACDEAAVRALGEHQSADYAEILLDMAEAARAAGGRLRWQGVGVVNGTSLIGRRIDRILRGGLLREISLTRKVIVMCCSVAAIFVAVACHQRAAPLTPDPEITARFAQQKEDGELTRAAWAMSEADVAALQLSWNKNPEDLAAAGKLLTYYEPVHNGVAIPHPERFEGDRVRILTWMIEHHPDHQLAASAVWRITPTDTAGYQQAHSAWLTVAARPGASATLVGNAAAFFGLTDGFLAEKTFLRAQAIDRASGIADRWTIRLGGLYANAVVGGRGFSPRFLPAIDAGAFAAHVRHELEVTTDARLLAIVGFDLLNGPGELSKRPGVVGPAVDQGALGETYARRALALDPNARYAREAIALQRDRMLRKRYVALIDGPRASVVAVPGAPQTSKAVQVVSKDTEMAKVMALSETERIAVIPQIMNLAYMTGEADDFEAKRKDARYPTRWYHSREAQEQDGLAAWERSRVYAETLLSLAPTMPADPNSAVALYHANVVLGLHALRAGNVRGAVRYMQAAGQVAPSEALVDSNVRGMDTRLVNYLLASGERESVAAFLERTSALVLLDREQRLKDAASIRKGQMPMSYQYQMTPH